MSKNKSKVVAKPSTEMIKMKRDIAYKDLSEKLRTEAIATFKPCLHCEVLTHDMDYYRDNPVELAYARYSCSRCHIILKFDLLFDIMRDQLSTPKDSPRKNKHYFKSYNNYGLMVLDAMYRGEKLQIQGVSAKTIQRIKHLNYVAVASRDVSDNTLIDLLLQNGVDSAVARDVLVYIRNHRVSDSLVQRAERLAKNEILFEW